MPNLLYGEENEHVLDEKNNPSISRRKFLSIIANGGAAAILASCSPRKFSTPSLASQPTSPVSERTAASTQKYAVGFDRIPRWRGFNLLEKYKISKPKWNQAFFESDLDIIADWGFDFIRLPMDYRIWTVSAKQFRKKPLRDIDHVINQARLRGIHVNLCLHRAPGYCVNPPKEPLNLWENNTSGEEARQLFKDQWAMFSERYQNIPPTDLSFNLVNEPPNISGATYARSVGPAIRAIRRISPDRLIIADGIDYGQQPVYELVPYKIAQSTRGYVPFSITHYQASWIGGSDQFAKPSWPIYNHNDQMQEFNKETLWNKYVEPWEKFRLQHSIGIHVGEWGAYKKTPHNVVLNWMKDSLKNWKRAEMGWALWNLRGNFGPLDSNRVDVVYENYKGHKLDRKMLELLKQY